MSRASTEIFDVHRVEDSGGHRGFVLCSRPLSPPRLCAQSCPPCVCVCVPSRTHLNICSSIRIPTRSVRVSLLHQDLSISRVVNIISLFNCKLCVCVCAPPLSEMLISARLVCHVVSISVSPLGPSLYLFPEVCVCVLIPPNLSILVCEVLSVQLEMCLECDLKRYPPPPP